MKKRSLLIVMLIMLALVTSGFTYAFWAAGIAADSETATGTIQVGTGETVTSTVNVSAAVNSQGLDKLVPAGYADGAETESLTLTFTVDWDSSDENGVGGNDAQGLVSTLTVALTGASNGTPAQDAAVLALLNAAFNGSGAGNNEYSITSDGSAATVIVTITLDEPANATEYGYIANKSLTLTFSFSVAGVSA